MCSFKHVEAALLEILNPAGKTSVTHVGDGCGEEWPTKEKEGFRCVHQAPVSQNVPKD